ncbi:MAG: hypothetical protein R2764_16645 [Bacteroidales bacterium]
MNQKEEEKLVMQYFRESRDDFPQGKLVVSESPDFMLRINRKKAFGIELTRLPESPNFVDALFEIMGKKEQKINHYRGKGFIEIWLIIYTNDLKKVNSFNLDNKINNLAFQSSFSKVFLFDLFERQIYDIQIH